MQSVFLEQRVVCAADGSAWAVHDMGEGDEVLLLLHGFPELGRSFRPLFEPFVQAGFRVIAPDLLGFGEHSQSRLPAGPGLSVGARALMALLDALGLGRVVVLGHDLGARLAYRMTRLDPSRVAGLVASQTPFAPMPPVPPTDLYRQALGDPFFLVCYQDTQRTAIELERDVARTLRYFLRKPAIVGATLSIPFANEGYSPLVGLAMDEREWGGASLLSPDDFAAHERAFVASGFEAPLSWFRGLDDDWSEARRLPEELSPPVLLVSGARSARLPRERGAAMREHCLDFHQVVLSEAGDFPHVEVPSAFAAEVIPWLLRLRRG